MTHMARRQGRDLKEELVASLVCAAHSLERAKQFAIVGRSLAPETHDFDATTSYTQEMLAIEVTEFHGTGLDQSVLSPEKMGFWERLIKEIEAGLDGKLQGTFTVHGGASQFPDIPGTKRQTWLRDAQRAILNLSSSLGVGEMKALGSPPEIVDMELEKIGGQGSQVQFVGTPITSQPVRADKAIEEFCETTLIEKNRGSLGTAKGRGKLTILAVLVEYPLDSAGLAESIRATYLKGDIPNIDRAYLVNLWSSEYWNPLLTRVV